MTNIINYNQRYDMASQKLRFTGTFNGAMSLHASNFQLSLHLLNCDSQFYHDDYKKQLRKLQKHQSSESGQQQPAINPVNGISSRHCDVKASKELGSTLMNPVDNITPTAKARNFFFSPDLIPGWFSEDRKKNPTAPIRGSQSNRRMHV